MQCGYPHLETTHSGYGIHSGYAHSRYFLVGIPIMGIVIMMHFFIGVPIMDPPLMSDSIKGIPIMGIPKQRTSTMGSFSLKVNIYAGL
jgi:hypothetical protein